MLEIMWCSKPTTFSTTFFKCILCYYWSHVTFASSFTLPSPFYYFKFLLQIVCPLQALELFHQQQTFHFKVFSSENPSEALEKKCFFFSCNSPNLAKHSSFVSN